MVERYGDRVVVPPLDLELGAGTRLGIVGPNGAGKTTLVRLLLGEIEPDSGVREVGETVRFMGIDQMRTDLDPSHTVAEEVAGSSDVIRTDERVVRVEGFLDKFGFKGPARQARISQLSGGERNRVLLAKLLCAGGNALVLDEPTNDLDLATLRALEEALIAFPGVVAIVSHDRWFLDRVATQILYMDGQGGTRLHHGDMSSLLKQIADQARAAQAAPRKAPKQEAPRKPGRAKRIAPWEQRELDELEGRIPTIESEIEAIDGELADPALYSGSGDAVAEIQSRRAALEAELAERYARWEELETLRG